MKHQHNHRKNILSIKYVTVMLLRIHGQTFILLRFSHIAINIKMTIASFRFFHIMNEFLSWTALKEKEKKNLRVKMELFYFYERFFFYLPKYCLSMF